MRFHFVVGLAALTASLSASAASDPTGRYKVIVDKMNELHNAHPNTTEIYSVGENDDGVEVLAMRVSTAPKAMDPKKIGQLVVSTHHGNELAAPEFTMYWLNELVKRYDTSELFRGNLADTEFTVIPVLNVSGYNGNNRYEHGQDPNRDYPGPCISGEGGKLKSIRIAMNVLASRVFTGSLTVHGYAAALTYPWGVSVGNTHTLDHNEYDRILKSAAELNGYRYGTSTDIVYPCDGAFEDYVYWKHGVWSLLLELKNGDANDIRDTSTAITYFFDQLTSSPSVKNQLTSQCQKSRKPDLHNE